jgi:hypothetical protein
MGPVSLLPRAAEGDARAGPSIIVADVRKRFLMRVRLGKSLVNAKRLDGFRDSLRTTEPFRAT